MRFIKFEGFGNDYIVFEAGEVAGVERFDEFVRAVCDRHYGAGADGIVTLGGAGVEGADAESTGADFVARIFNADGSEAGLSGNGTRCAAAYLHYTGLWSRAELRLKTLAGVKLYRLRERTGDGHYWFDSELGQPRFDSASIPMLADTALERVVSYPLVVDGETWPITALSIGNPHCLIFVRDFEAVDWRRAAYMIESHQQFPERINVTFVRVLDRENIEIRIWERGVGETLSSGTCSCAAAIASIVNGRTERRINVATPGGRLEVLWREDGEVVLTGRADVVYSGQWLGSRSAQ
ncbi:MAG TPA: diaminopimelate epimerase [Pyrinomonadaceae bacterium]|jgi:diaminopimelate epimerase|nr:diaminopimelate epimerase [Pyrinomonadaceae bacterium]